ncbi:PREDICTED: uncharacterized protein LOC106783642 [Polistes canadensis]|uniref:uncharacterized protein LOC106783642 n=1 Tax=Polistes canadensis TaxID=91411 RepID=UPI000718B553|nr:PREDICTED: uncharacterized protein LOC106783642 [Polistes canadensis]
MDYSTKVTVKSEPDPEQEQEHEEEQVEIQADAASPSSSIDLPENTHPCPACPSILPTSHDLTNHLREHNSPRSTDYGGEEDYCCAICQKVLSSASSLDRHVLVHSRERPFKCKYCDIAFTTNGNMNRHVKSAHRGERSPPQSYTESESTSNDSVNSSKRQPLEEHNNNEISKRTSPNFLIRERLAKNLTNKRKSPSFTREDENPRKHKILLNNSRTEIKRTPIETQNSYNCPVCNRQDFATSGLLETHLEQNHPEFTARAMCEQAMHRPASGEGTNFQCSKCSRAFPCFKSMKEHQNECGTMSSEYHEEEAQDLFAAEFRKMKLKGEFPCRLCTSIFPNLRALKGHNRAHMGVGPGVPYPCNMCPYTSTDKATLVRHLRSHNGDRPYECSLCNYAFTTKANCERHVRNRHGKLTREDIKSVLIYHPNEDSTNDNIGNSPRLTKDEARKSLIYPNDREDSMQQQQQQQRYLPIPVDSKGDIRVIEEAKLPSPELASSIRNMIVNHCESNDTYGRSSIPGSGLISRTMEEATTSQDQSGRADDDLESRSSNESVPLVINNESDMHQRMQASPINLKKMSNQSNTGNLNQDGPLDLSMDVLDLSKKAKERNGAGSLRSNEYPNNDRREFYDSTSQLFLTQALLQASQNTSPGTSPSTSQGNSQTNPLQNFYANAQIIYRNLGSISNRVNAGILSSYMFNSQFFGQDLNISDRIQKEFARGLQLTSGGTLVDPSVNNNNFPAFPQANDAPSQMVTDQNDYTNLLGTKMTNKTISPREKVDNSVSTNSVKMIIKNGVLMPKQKQRRYRTERPFSCGHCSAKFTLRSNMERHIKQQHPEFWSQRPRGGHSTRGRPPANHQNIMKNSGQSNSQSSSQSYSSILPKGDPSTTKVESTGRHSISEQVKYAILAQQLKANKMEDNDTDEELIIDEDPIDKEIQESQEQTEQRSTSLLRGQLEGNESNKDIIVKEEILERDSSDVFNNEQSKEHNNTNENGQSSGNEQSINDKTDDTTLDGNSRHTFKMDNCNDNITQDKQEDNTADLASVSELLDNASHQYQHFQPQYLSDEEGLVASTSDFNNSGSDDKSDSVNSGNSNNASSKKKKKKKKKKKSAYSLAPNRVMCPFCDRPFPWTSSLRRHILTHTGQKPFKCIYCSLLFTTKSNCDRHLLRKHKTNPYKIRRARNSSSPESQVVNTNNTFSMRNVPERPYKCNQCPSSTFSTLGNLKKHRSTKHSRKNKLRSVSPSTEPQNSPLPSSKQNDLSDYESRSSSVSENTEQQQVSPSETQKQNSNNSNASLSNNELSRSRRTSPRSSPGPNDVPFKCHLCDCGFADRHDCLEHIKINHNESYEMLVAKGAMDMDIDGLEDHQVPPPPPQQQHLSDGEERKGRFPDYSNRKVVCAFCIRRFWSAEDLRRHMRTHTGERPFSCDICLRRFTLKHSMLRHRKKHESVDSTMYVGTSGDEENSPTQPPTITPRTQKQPPVLMATNINNSRIQDRISLSVATGDAAPGGGGFMRYNSYEKLTTFAGKLTANNPQQHHHNNNAINNDLSENTDNDLISNLLGIRDKSFIDKVLQASPDDAAKLLGVQRSHE